MSQELERFQDLLRELFQFDSADLDFGIYRILNARRGLFEDWLTRSLPEQVEAALSKGALHRQDEQAERLSVLAGELRDEYGEDCIDGDGKLVDEIPDRSARAKEYRALLVAAQQNGSETSADAVVADIYNRLYDFFRRYYEDGDFLSLRRYGAADHYAVPYNGEEVLLHWANKDQYYIKTGEHFTDYCFRAGDAADAWMVEFKLERAEADRDNTRSSDKRYFFFDVAAVAVDGDARRLTVPVQFRAPTDSEKASLGKKNVQDKLNAEAEQKLPAKKAIKAQLVLVQALAHNVSDDPEKRQTMLAHHLRRYTRKNTSDFFIHKDLGGFLRRELDYYLKSEVLRLDALLAGGEQPAQAWLQRLSVLRDIGNRIIDFLAQVEDLQKKLFEKRKFITECQWCITLDHVESAGLTDELVKLLNGSEGGKAQKGEWKKLFAVDEIEAGDGQPGWKDKVTAAFLRSQPCLVLDTAFMPRDFTDKLLASFDDLDAQTNGVLVHSENFQALNLLIERYREQVQCVYVDPPFNTGLGDFFYRDNYEHSTWLSMMNNCTNMLTKTLTSNGTLYAHIDYYEKERLKLLLDDKLNYVTEIIWRIGWISGYKSKANKFIRNHDTIYQYSKGHAPFFVKQYIPYPEGYVRRDGNAPEGQGYPLEDTWNCSELDSLNSIQIVSFSKEKVGDDSLTQKNENLVDRMITSSTVEDQVVLDSFVGSGTTAAVAQKSGRRWVAAEMGTNFVAYTLPRMKRVLFGDKYGVSAKYNYPRGGFFKYFRMESYEDTLANLEIGDSARRQAALKLAGDDYSLGYDLDFDTADSATRLNVEQLAAPFEYTLTIHDGKQARTEHVDLPETFAYLIGLIVQCRRSLERDGRRYLLYVGSQRANGARTAVLWRDIRGWDEEQFAVERRWVVEEKLLEGCTAVFVNGDSAIEGAQSLDPVFKARMFAPVH